MAWSDRKKGREYRREIYRKNPEREIKNALEWQRNNPKYAEYKREYQRELSRKRKAKLDAIRKESGCIDCGTKENLCFDHRVKEEKLFTIGSGVRRAWNVIEAEIAKCDVRCTSCHAKRHKSLGDI